MNQSLLVKVKLCLCIGFIAATLMVPVAAEESAAKTPTILVVGDSLSAGYGLRPGEGWVTLLEQRLDSEGFPHEVVNASITGDTSRGALARFPRALDVHDPDLVIIEIGGNDGLRGQPLDALRDNIIHMIALARDADAEVLLLGIQLPANYGPDYTEQFRQLYPDLAAAQEVPYAPFVREEIALDPEMMLDDGVHPNAAAQPLMLEYVWPELAAMLSGSGSRADAPAAAESSP